MLKKVSLLMLVFVMAFSPALTVAASEGSEDQKSLELEATADNTVEVSVEEEVETVHVEDAEGLTDDPQEVVVEQDTEPLAEEVEKVVIEETTQVEEGSEENVVKSTDTSTEETIVDVVEDEVASVDEETEEPTEEEQSEDPSEDEVTEDQANEDESSEETDENPSLFLINGTAEGKVTFDFNQGVYILDLEAGFQNSSGKEITNKWIAFALPKDAGVNLPYGDEDYLEGVKRVSLGNGIDGLAIKIPDVKRYGSEYVNHTIPLIAFDEVEDTNTDLYLFGENTDTNELELVGTINGDRDIDFSEIVEGYPELKVEGSVSGSTEFNSEKHYYDLDLTIELTNNLDQELYDQYVGFEIPEGVMVVNDDKTNYEILKLDNGKQALAIPISTIEKGENEQNYTIPLIGKTDGSVSDTNLTLYRIDKDPINGGYYVTGEFPGEANIDYSAMNQDWFFDGQSQLVEGFPGLPDNQFGLRFAFNIQNLTLNDVDEVKIEFLVPDNITVHEPDEYQDGEIPDSLEDFLNNDLSGANSNLDIDWNGNTATIKLDTLDASEWNSGYFTALGESNESLQDLEGLNVRLTLYRDGNEQVEELTIPFEIVPFEGPGNGDNGNEDDGDDNNNEDTDSGNNQNGGSGNDNDGSDDNENEGTDGNNNSNNNEDEAGGNNSDDNNDNGSSDTSKDGDALPKTGSFFSTWFWQLLGALMLVSGGFVYRRSRIVSA